MEKILLTVLGVDKDRAMRNALGSFCLDDYNVFIADVGRNIRQDAVIKNLRGRGTLVAY
ncbi:MAG: hypothetical protein JSU92_06400 [Deltaproteobacteria bacterium]|nr:MAG: hypothetical protein JSU92_06400 [Deltaproteobacteria bacterium]